MQAKTIWFCLAASQLPQPKTAVLFFQQKKRKVVLSYMLKTSSGVGAPPLYKVVERGRWRAILNFYPNTDRSHVVLSKKNKA